MAQDRGENALAVESVERIGVGVADARRHDLRPALRLAFGPSRSSSTISSGFFASNNCNGGTKRLSCQGIEALTMISNAGTPHGLLRITCSVALGEYALIPILNDFAARYPEVRLSIDLSNRIADLIGEGYDLAIRTGNLADSRFIGTRIASRRLFTCASPAYLHKSGVPGSIMDLKHHDCLIGSSTSWHFVDAGKEQVYTPRGRWACNNGHAVLNAALADLGICQLPDYYVRTHVEAGELVPLLEECAPPDEPVWAVYPQRRHLSPNVRHLVDLLKERMPALMANPVTRSPDKAC
jgi:DNA-binding transcriptional LysR family regulator